MYLLLNYEYPPLGGGAGAVTRFQAEGLAEAGHKVTLITAWFEGQKEEEVSGNLRIIRLPSYRKHLHKSGMREKLSWMFKAKTFLLEHCKTNTYSACLTHFTLPGGYVAMALNKRFGLPYAIVSHGHDIPWFFPQQMLVYHTLLYPAIKFIATRASAIVVLNERLKQNALRFMPQEQGFKVNIIPNGCDMDMFYQGSEARPDVFTVIFAGRLTAQKDPMTFLRAMQHFASYGYPFEVKIYGDGPLKPAMEAFVEKHFEPRQFQFYGWTNTQEMAKAYQSAHVHVISSVAEAMSVAALESLASGTYLISTDTGSARDIITENINGNIVPIKQAQLITQRLNAYYNNFFLKRRKVADEALLSFRNTYKQQNIIKQYEVLLAKIKK